MKWSLSGCNFYFLVPSAPVAFGLNVYDRWTGLCLHHLVYNPSVCIYAMLGSGTGPMGIFISADFLSASIVLLQCPLSLMDLALCWAHLQNIVSASCQISIADSDFFFPLTHLPTRTLKMDQFHIVNALPLLSACKLHFGTSLLALFASIKILDKNTRSIPIEKCHLSLPVLLFYWKQKLSPVRQWPL